MKIIPKIQGICENMFGEKVDLLNYSFCTVFIQRTLQKLIKLKYTSFVLGTITLQVFDVHLTVIFKDITV